jgi:hypothetical protein
VNNAGPLSAARYPNDEWPEEVKAQHRPETNADKIARDAAAAGRHPSDVGPEVLAAILGGRIMEDEA